MYDDDVRVVCRIRPLRSEEAGQEVVRVRHQQGPEAEDGRLVFGTTAFEFDRVGWGVGVTTGRQAGRGQRLAGMIMTEGGREG